MYLVSVHDVKAESYSNPVASTNKATAMRDFATAVNQPGGLLNSHPDDFILVCLGTFDPASGVIVPECYPLASGRDVLNVKDN